MGAPRADLSGDRDFSLRFLPWARSAIPLPLHRRNRDRLSAQSNASILARSASQHARLPLRRAAQNALASAMWPTAFVWGERKQPEAHEVLSAARRSSRLRT
jgi:hypothetical protein